MKILRLMIFVHIAAMTVACQVTGQQRTTIAAPHTAELIIASNELDSSIELINPIFRKATSFEQVQVTVKNTSTDRIELQYQIRWKDSSGVVLSGERQWHHLFLSPNETKQVTSTAHSVKGSSISMQVRTPLK